MMACLQVIKGIVGQGIFQLGTMYALVFLGPSILGITAGSSTNEASVHYTLCFNAFVLMQLFNQVNARKINDEPNVLEGILDNRLFLGILGAEALLQVGLGSLHKLCKVLWLWCAISIQQSVMPMDCGSHAARCLSMPGLECLAAALLHTACNVSKAHIS